MDLDHAFKRRDWDGRLLAKVQDLCRSYPEVVEAEQFGGPWWKAGKKAFALYGAESEKRPDGSYRAIDGVGLKLPLFDQEDVLKDPRFSRDRYIGHAGWTHFRFTGKKDEWDIVVKLVDVAYRNVANQRQLKALRAGPD